MEFPWSYWGTTCGHASGYRKTPRRPSSFRMATKSNRVTSLVHLEGPIDYTGKAGPEVCRSLAGSQGRSPEFDMGLGKGWNNGISTHRKFILEGMCCFQVSLPPVHPLAKNYKWIALMRFMSGGFFYARLLPRQVPVENHFNVGGPRVCKVICIPTSTRRVRSPQKGVVGKATAKGACAPSASMADHRAMED